jgi:hypothetical protein
MKRKPIISKTTEPSFTLTPPADWDKARDYYIYHDEGHYDYLNGSYREVCGIPYTERYDHISNNRGLNTLQESINHMNECRARSSPPIPPVKIKRIVMWKCGMAVEVGNVGFWKSLYER